MMKTPATCSEGIQRPVLWRCKTVLRILVLRRASKPNGHSSDLFHAVESCDVAAVDFLHQENTPTWAGVELATLGTEGQ
ncbi:hypothetical protein TNCV_1930761 [Trichonephila clavipes]|nr:hypothetical protein TNCV_1930761 [Trichonephila clavipes]